MYDEAKHIKALVEAMRKEQGLKKGLQKASIKELWKELWGENIDKYTQKLVFNNGILTVYLNSSTLREELNRKKADIMLQMNEKMGETAIKKIIFK
jgi:predicted nucleic acid-binding Zn ribbon protein